MVRISTIQQGITRISCYFYTEEEGELEEKDKDFAGPTLGRGVGNDNGRTWESECFTHHVGPELIRSHDAT